MALLTTLTLIYAVVLVVALAASLIAILVYLRRIAAVLGEVHDLLAEVNRQADPLESHLHPLHGVAGGAAQEIESTKEKLAHADEQLTTLLQRVGARRQAG